MTVPGIKPKYCQEATGVCHLDREKYDIEGHSENSLPPLMGYKTYG